MEKKEVKVGNKFIPIEAGGVIPMTEEEWNDFQKQMKVERDYFYMIGNKKYIHYEDEDYVRVSDIQQELDKAREEGRKEGLVENLDKRNSEGGLTILESLMLSKLKSKEEK